MNRRTFLKSSGLVVPTLLWLPKAAGQIVHGPVAPGYVASAACATTDTSIAHDEFLEGFQTATTGFNDGNTWTASKVGTTANVDAYYDSSALTSNKPTGACDRCLRVTGPSDATSTYARWVRSSPIALGTYNVDVVAYLYISALPTTGNVINALTLRGSYDDLTGRVEILNNSGTGYARFNSSVASDYFTTFTTGTWHKVTIHFDTTAANSTFQLDSETAKSFTRYNTAWRNELLEVLAGCTPTYASGVFSGSYLYCDLICLNTP